MGAIYSNAAEEVAPLVEGLMAEHHEDLLSAKVKIDFIFAVASLDPKTEEPTGPAITHHGYRAMGLTKILSLKERTMGRGDAEILLDGDVWPGLNEKCRLALLDHELNHLEVKRDSSGGFVFDDLDRPKLVMRKHDWQAGFFHIIAERWGAESQELLQLRNLCVNQPLYRSAAMTSIGDKLQKLANGLGNVTVTIHGETNP